MKASSELYLSLKYRNVTLCIALSVHSVNLHVHAYMCAIVVIIIVIKTAPYTIVNITGQQIWCDII